MEIASCYLACWWLYRYKCLQPQSFFSSNGHWYEAIETGSTISWDNAKTAAESLNYLGGQGHLATLTSQEENDFIWNNLGGINLRNYWLGGFQEICTPEPSCGWQWVTGEVWNYMNWATGEPNNVANGLEDKLEFLGYTGGGTDNGQWNDELSTNFLSTGYIVEYAVSVPEPTTIFLPGLGLAGLGFTRKRLIA